MDKLRKDKTTRYLLLLTFVFLSAYIKYAHHELWKDEWQAWFVAKDKSIGEIFSFLYYEGHPALWYLYLKIFTIASGVINPVFLISFAHLLIVSAGLYFLFVRFRLPLVLTTMCALSYFFFFEYGIVNRGYSLVILFTFWAVSLIRDENYNKYHVGAVLFLLCQTEVYGALIALVFGFYLFLKIEKSSERIKYTDFYGLAAGMMIFLVSVFPRASDHVSKTRGKNLSLADNFLTSLQGNLSNTYLIGSTNDTFAFGWTIIGLILSAFCLVGLYYVFKVDKKMLLTYSAYLAIMVAFSFFFFLGGVRQWGMGFIFLMAMLEIRGINLAKERISSAIVGIFCIFGMIHNFKAVREEIRLPFTNAELIGSFIREKVPIKVPIVAINKFEATPVIGYAGRNFYELPDGVEFSYFRWVDRIYIPTEIELKLFARFKGVGGIVILSPKPLEAARYPSAKLWQKFDGENYKKENYYLYTLAGK